MTSKLDRRALLRLGGAAAATGMAASRVVAQDTPAGPTTPMPPVETFARPPVVGNIALSPDGERIAMVTQKGDTKILLDFSVEDPDAIRILPLGPVKIRSILWSDNAHVLVLESQTADLEGFAGGAHEFYLGRVVNPATKQVRTLFDGKLNVLNMIIGDVQRLRTAGGYRLSASTYHVNGRYTLFSFAADGSDARELWSTDIDNRGFVINAEGQPLAYATFSEAGKAWSLHYNRAEPGRSSSFRKIYEVKAPIERPYLSGIGSDGRSVVIHSGTEDGGAYHEIGSDGILRELAGAPQEAGVAPLFHPYTGHLAGWSAHDDWVRYAYFDPLMKKLSEALPVIMGEGQRPLIVDFAEEPRKMIVYGEGSDNAGAYYFSDLTTGDFWWVADNYPDLPAEWISHKKAIRYKAADGLEIRGYLTLPPFRTAKNLPLIVLPHGGPQARDDIGFDWQSQLLASRGYAVLQPNFRGSSGYGDDFVRRGHGEWGRKMQTDLSDGVNWLAAEGTIDPGRVAILGASYGGYAALAGATLDTGVYRCAVSVAGVSDLRDMLAFEAENHNGRRASAVLYWRQFMGDAKHYDDLSPARRAENAYCPIMLIHGTDDTVVPVSQSRRMEKALKAAGKPVEFVTYEGQDHWETVGSHRVAMMETALAFLQKHNPA